MHHERQQVLASIQTAIQISLEQKIRILVSWLGHHEIFMFTSKVMQNRERLNVSNAFYILLGFSIVSDSHGEFVGSNMAFSEDSNSQG